MTLLVDSEATEAANVKGTSPAADHLDLIGILWDVVTCWDVPLYVSRVPTDSDPIDGAVIRVAWRMLGRYRSFALCAQQGALARGAPALGMQK